MGRSVDLGCVWWILTVLLNTDGVLHAHRHRNKLRTKIVTFRANRSTVPAYTGYYPWDRPGPPGRREVYRRWRDRSVRVCARRSTVLPPSGTFSAVLITTCMRIVPTIDRVVALRSRACSPLLVVIGRWRVVSAAVHAYAISWPSVTFDRSVCQLIRWSLDADFATVLPGTWQRPRTSDWLTRSVRPTFGVDRGPATTTTAAAASTISW